MGALTMLACSSSSSSSSLFSGTWLKNEPEGFLADMLMRLCFTFLFNWPWPWPWLGAKAFDEPRDRRRSAVNFALLVVMPIVKAYSYNFCEVQVPV